MEHEPICWAVLLPASQQQSTTLAHAFHHARYGHLDITPWPVIGGSGAYSAVIEEEEGSEGSDDPLAEAVSQKLDGAVYLLRFRVEAPAVWVYRGGRRIDVLDEAPEETAARLGVTLPTSEVSATTNPSRIQAICVVEVASVDEVRNALGDGANADGLRIQRTAAGDVLVHADNGDIGMLAYDIADALPAARIWQVVTGPGRFGVHLLQGHTTLGMLEVGEEEDSTLADVRGETEPARILGALGVPADAVYAGP